MRSIGRARLDARPRGPYIGGTMAGKRSRRGGKDPRAERLARALRANLHRRKARARRQETDTDPTAEGTGAGPTADGSGSDRGEAGVRPDSGGD